MGKLVKVSKGGDRLTQLVELRNIIADAIDKCDSMRDLASLSRQYRETLDEIEAIEDAGERGDQIAELLSRHNAAGKSTPNS